MDLNYTFFLQALSFAILIFFAIANPLLAALS